MKRLVLLPLFLILELIRENIVKTIFVTIAILALYFSYNVDREMVNTDRVYAKFIDDENYTNYVIKSGNSYSVKQFDKPLKITKNTITYEEMSDVRFLLLLIHFISLVFLVIGFIMGLTDDDLSWNFNDCWLSAFSTLVVCELENDIYYYIILGRLIHSSNKLNSVDRLLKKLDIYGFKDLINYPKFKTKTQTRNAKLNKLGI
jgi:hypothetical protein